MSGENTELMKVEMARIAKEAAESIQNYKKNISYYLGDAPIETLCLPKATEKLLINEGCLRVYDLFDRDFTKIKGFGVTRIRDLTSRLNQFFSIG
jgi:hypothetical protein